MNTREFVINKRKENPCATLQNIADKCGITKERVRQILNTENLPTKHLKIKHKTTCLKCDKEFYINEGYHKKFCSRECLKIYRSIQIECSECHKLFIDTEAQLMNRLKNRKVEEIFCSRKCYGKWFSRKYGFAAYPEHIIGLRNKGKSKYNKSIPYIAQLIDNGYSLTNILRELGITRGLHTFIRDKVREYNKSK